MKWLLVWIAIIFVGGLLPIFDIQAGCVLVIVGLFGACFVTPDDQAQGNQSSAQGLAQMGPRLITKCEVTEIILRDTWGRTIGYRQFSESSETESI